MDEANRKRVPIYEELSSNLDYMTLGEAAAYLAKKAISDPNLKITEYQPEWSGNPSLYIVSYRPETDAEMEKRVESENYYRKLRETQERATFEELKKKFGNV